MQKANEADARNRMNAFWAGSSLGRPAIYVIAKRPGFSPKEWSGEKDRKKRDLLPQWHIWNNTNMIDGTIYLAEAFPRIGVDFGSLLSMVAIQAGSDYFYSSDGYAWVCEYPEVYDHPLPCFNKMHPVIKKLEACYDEVVKAFDNKGYINPPVMLDAMTTLSLLRKPDRLCIDIIETPDKVKTFTSALTDIYIDSYDHFYTILKKQGYTETSSWLQSMACGSFEAVQCDFATMISPAMFDKFVLPDIYRLTEYFDYSLYHLDGTCQMRFLNVLRSLPRLTGIQWNPEPNAGSPSGWIDALREIRKKGFCLHVWCEYVEEAVAITKELGPDGLFLSFTKKFDTEKEADAAIRTIERIC